MFFQALRRRGVVRWSRRSFARTAARASTTRSNSYPLADYIRVFDPYARARFSGSSPRGGHRLVARGEVEVFAASTLGKVTFSMLNDPAVALLRYPELFGVLCEGTRHERRACARAVRHAHVPRLRGLDGAACRRARGARDGVSTSSPRSTWTSTRADERSSPSVGSASAAAHADHEAGEEHDRQVDGASPRPGAAAQHTSPA